MICARQWHASRAPPGTMCERERPKVALSAEDMGTLTEADWVWLRDRHEYLCAYCGLVGPLAAEHVLPIARGGRHTLGNILPVCRSCNSSEGRPFSEWRYYTRRRRVAERPSVLALRYRPKSLGSTARNAPKACR